MFAQVWASDSIILSFQNYFLKFNHISNEKNHSKFNISCTTLGLENPNHLH